MVRAFLTIVLLASAAAAGAVDERYIVLQSTTSTQNSGLLDFLIPKFRRTHGIDVRVIAVGTGQALRNARNGDGDVLMVHAKVAEEAFVAEGWGVARHDLMYNDFVIVGPAADPAQVREAASAADALARIATARAAFASRGDDSGTHRKELALWRAAGIDVASASGTWYRETGGGMGATLNVAAGMDAYTLTDRATWISFGNKSGLTLLNEGDDALFNQYGVILVNPERHPAVRAEAGHAFIDWLLGADGQAAIAAYRVDGQQLFFPNATR